MAYVECLTEPSERRQGTKWNAERKERLRQLIEEKNSGAECAAIINSEFGVSLSRNSIMGAAFRFGFQLKSQTHNTRIAGKAKAKTRHAVVSRSKAPKLELIIPDISDLDIPQEQRKTFMQLESRDCRYPIGNVGTSDFFFCGGETQEDSSYCPRHHRLTRAVR